MLIPSLMPETGHYPRTGDDLRGIRHFSDDFYFTVLRRFWLADFIHEGFWPQLICRIANDQQIVQVYYVLNFTNFIWHARSFLGEIWQIINVLVQL